METGMNFAMQRPKGLEDWQSSVAPEIVERAKKALKDNQHSFSSTSNFIGVGETDKNVSIRRSQACHAAMTDIGVASRDVLATENGQRRKPLTEEVAEPFLRWFINDSPYAFIILNRDDYESCRDLGFVIAGDAPTTLVQSACIISRHFYEVTTRAFQEFNKLVSRGIDGFIAYQLCFNSNISSASNNSDFNSSLFYGGSAHRVSAAISPQTMLNYYRGEVQNDLGKTYKEKPSIYGSTKLFIRNGSYPVGSGNLSTLRTMDLAFHNFLLEKEGKLVKKQEVYRPPNPFAPKPKSSNEKWFTLQQAITVVADYCQDYVSSHLNESKKEIVNG